MKVKDVIMILNDSKMQEQECNFKLLRKRPTNNVILDSLKQILQRLDQIEQRLDRVEQRLDNIVKLNHLKE